MSVDLYAELLVIYKIEQLLFICDQQQYGALIF